MLRVDHLTIERGDFAINADFEISPGTICGVIGPSGAGKTSLATALAGLTPISTGSVYWNDAYISQLPPSERPIALMFQEHNLFTHLNITQNLLLADRDRVKVDEWIENLGLTPYRKQRPQTLSGGQKARAAFARTLISNRPIKIFDEPFAAVGPAQRRKMQGFLTEVIREAPGLSLVVAHNINDLRGWADQILWVGETIKGPFPTDEFFKTPPTEAKSYL